MLVPVSPALHCLCRVPMSSPSATPRLLYRSTRLLRTAFQHLHQQQQRADVFCDAVLQAEGEQAGWPTEVLVPSGDLRAVCLQPQGGAGGAAGW